MTLTTTNNKVTEHIFFKKPTTAHRFVFCGLCAIVQRSDNIPRHFQRRHLFGAAFMLEKGQIPLFAFTNQWERYIEKCIASKRAITQKQWLLFKFHRKNNWITKKIKEGQRKSKVWYNGEHVVMCRKTWHAFKINKWERTKKIRSLNRTIYKNICDSNKEKFDLKTELSDIKL